MSEMLLHDSAEKHVTGKSVYINDIISSERLLIGRVVYSPHAHARIKSFDLTEASKLKGVYAILSSKDIPGENQMGPVFHDEPCLADGVVNCIGQAVFIIAAENDEIAMKAEKLINVEYEVLEPILEIETAIEKGTLIAPPRKIETGNPDDVLKKAPHILKGVLKTGSQEHWYLETQSCLSIPGESDEMNVFASSQNPAETQAIVAEVLGVSKNEVVVEVRRMGGAFGGKETQGNHVAAWSALLAKATGRPVKFHLFRDDDQKITGKRHRFISEYELGYDDQGKILAYTVDLNCDAGCATDLTMAILERAMLHSDSSYYIPNMRVIGKAWRTNLPSNTAYRGFGGPQGMAVIENLIDMIARELKKDPDEIRKINFYGMDSCNTTHYGETVENNRLFIMHEQIHKMSEYQKRREEIKKFNKENEFYKKGISLTPVKFGISFTTAFLNQAGALVNIYTDGTVLVNHGGTEMGQGLHTKMQHIAASELGINPHKVKVNATNTSKVPNASATAASSGSDINGMAVKNAVDILKSRITEVVIREFNGSGIQNPSKPENIVFEKDFIYDKQYPERKIAFTEIIPKAYLQQVSLSTTGFYKTPDIYFNRETGKGRPFHYFTFGMAVSEVMIDTLTGRHQLLRTDILNDAGNSLNPAIDIGQVQGGFIQGVGWVTTEDMKWDDKGNLLNHSPDTYKIPTIQDIPAIFNVKLLEGYPNENTIQKSKAVGEPPFMLAFSVWLAIKDAISAVADHNEEPMFLLPSTNENILLAVEKLRLKIKQKI
jgi:xanthine dehydrogenase large subunit